MKRRVRTLFVQGSSSRDNRRGGRQRASMTQTLDKWTQKMSAGASFSLMDLIWEQVYTFVSGPLNGEKVYVRENLRNHTVHDNWPVLVQVLRRSHQTYPSDSTSTVV